LIRIIELKDSLLLTYIIKKQFSYILLFFGCSFLGKAQLRNHLLYEQSNIFQTHHAFSFNFKGINLPDNINNAIMSNHATLQVLPKSIASSFIKDLPFFCAMECKVHKLTNIWIKLRAGDDESYMKLIKSASR